MKIYSNFREIKSGSISPGILYRSDHPVCDGRQVSDIAIAAGLARIKTAINLTDSDASLKSKLAVCPWYKELYENGNVIALNMNMFFTGPLFCKKLKRGLLFIIEHESPYLIHCEAGIDRTGFVSLLLEALMGAGFDEIVKEYMLSFVSPSEYNVDDYEQGSIYVQNTFSQIKGCLIGKNDNLQEISARHLSEKIGLIPNEIALLIQKLSTRP